MASRAKPRTNSINQPVVTGMVNTIVSNDNLKLGNWSGQNVEESWHGIESICFHQTSHRKKGFDVLPCTISL